MEITPCPAEAHHQIGQVESLIKKLKQNAVTLLAGRDLDAHRALLHAAAAHNTVHRVQGFSPTQWAFGRDLDPMAGCLKATRDFLYCKHNRKVATPCMTSYKTRKVAEDISRRSQAAYQLGRLLNMRTQRKRTFLSGDLIFYRRIQPPADHPAGYAKVGQGRWFGPGRVLASETRMDAGGLERQAAQVIWWFEMGG